MRLMLLIIALVCGSAYATQIFVTVYPGKRALTLNYTPGITKINELKQKAAQMLGLESAQISFLQGGVENDASLVKSGTTAIIMIREPSRPEKLGVLLGKDFDSLPAVFQSSLQNYYYDGDRNSAKSGWDGNPVLTRVQLLYRLHFGDSSVYPNLLSDEASSHYGLKVDPNEWKSANQEQRKSILKRLFASQGFRIKGDGSFGERFKSITSLLQNYLGVGYLRDANVLLPDEGIKRPEFCLSKM